MSKAIKWLASCAGDWMEASANKYAKKALGEGPTFARNATSMLLLETVGALYWGFHNGFGMKDRESFIKYMTEACGWKIENILKAADEIEAATKEFLDFTAREVAAEESEAKNRVKQAEVKTATHEILSKTPANELEPARRIEEKIEETAEAWTYAQYRASLALRDKLDTPVDLDAGAFVELTKEELAAQATKPGEKIGSASPEVLGFPGTVRADGLLLPLGVNPLEIEPSKPDNAPKPSAADRTIPLFLGEEPLNILQKNLAEKGRVFSLIDIAGWTVVKRDVARAWVEQGGDMPDFLTACAACDRGEPYVMGREYLHTGEGELCKGAVKSAPKKPTKNERVVRPGIPCTACAGSGYDASGSEPRTACGMCDGSGKKLATCGECLGAGCNDAGDDCEACNATGKVAAVPDAVMSQLDSPLVSPVLTNGNGDAPPKRGRGRPPGSKNKKLPKDWAYAKERADAEVARLKKEEGEIEISQSEALA